MLKCFVQYDIEFLHYRVIFLLSHSIFNSFVNSHYNCGSPEIKMRLIKYDTYIIFSSAKLK